MEEYSFTRYLEAKKSVDDRALNIRVWARLKETLPEKSGQAPLKVLEIGAGTGAMLHRLVSGGMIVRGEYTAVDSDPENTTCAATVLADWAAGAGWEVKKAENGLSIDAPGGRLEISLQTADLFDFIKQQTGKKTWDLVVAHAFLDLVDIPFTLPLLKGLVEPGGLFYFTINFDGMTALEPAIDPQLDEQIVRLYHDTMDERVTDGRRSGDSRAGRHLFEQLTRAGLEVLEAGSSDWVVYPRGGEYPADEAYFLRHILHFFEESLAGHPALDAGRFKSWMEKRRAQIDRAELVYIAHQLDFLARKPEG